MGEEAEGAEGAKGAAVLAEIIVLIMFKIIKVIIALAVVALPFAFLGYLTHLVSNEEDQGSPPLSPPSSPPQPSNSPAPPLSPPSPVPSAAYLSPLAVGLIGGAAFILLGLEIVLARNVPNPNELLVFELLKPFLLVVYPLIFSLFILLGLTQDFKM